MKDLPLLMRIPDDLVPLSVIAVGGVMLVIITIIHGFGLDLIVGRYTRRAEEIRHTSWRPSRAVLLFAGTILLMLFLHLGEISFWALVLYAGGLVANYHQAAYFAANTYTTLGMGNMVLPHTWHEMSPMIAISGLFAFAWTTSEMFNIVGTQRDVVHELWSRRRQRIASQPATQR